MSTFYLPLSSRTPSVRPRESLWADQPASCRSPRELMPMSVEDLHRSDVDAVADDDDDDGDLAILALPEPPPTAGATAVDHRTVAEQAAAQAAKRFGRSSLRLV